MRRFHFRLETLLQVKVNQREILEAEIMNLQAELDQLNDQLIALVDDLENTNDARLDMLLKGAGGDDILTLHESWVVLYRQIQQKEEEMWDKEQVLDKKRQEHFEVYSECRALEKMKERAKQAWWLNALAEEQKSLDEFGTQRHMRNLRES